MAAAWFLRVDTLDASPRVMRPNLEPLEPSAWKREFQRRGAPHLHLAGVWPVRTPAPNGQQTWYPATGGQRTKVVNRRYRLPSLVGTDSGFGFLASDDPSIAIATTTQEEAPWPRGQPRPLP